MIDYAGKTALVTGGASGIGRALAEGLAQRGASDLVAARTVEGAAAAAVRTARPGRHLRSWSRLLRRGTWRRRRWWGRKRRCGRQGQWKL